MYSICDYIMVCGVGCNLYVMHLFYAVPSLFCSDLKLMVHRFPKHHYSQLPLSAVWLHADAISI
ncbi:hypothetical protein [Halocatena marina]|uniref:hypothetical protein n=1 Tax=Halocatena marina TaxID=2934937 RepID=UPI0036F32BFB